MSNISILARDISISVLNDNGELKIASLPS